jgi:hypothetical protein
MRLGLASLVLGALLGTSACFFPSKSCHLVGCENDVTIDVVVVGGVPSDTDVWTLTVDLDGARSVITCDAALSRCTTQSGGIEGYYNKVVFSLSLPGKPAGADVRVELRGAVVAEEHVGFAYSYSYPNGEACDEEPCISAHSKVVANRALAPDPSDPE